MPLFRPLVVALLLGTLPAHASLLVPMPDADLVARSTVVVRGTVEDVAAGETPDGAIVTRVVIRVDETLKGHVGRSRLRLTEVGGRVRERLVHVFGTPAYEVGETVLVFARPDRRGRLHTTGMALGKYRLQRTPGGWLAARHEPAPDVRPLGSFAAVLPALATTAADVLVPSPDARVRRFTFLGNPPGRWFEFDRGKDVVIRIANGDKGIGRAQSNQLVAEAFAAWTDVAFSTARVRPGEDSATALSVASGLCDGQSILQFNDPLGELPELDACSGVLAVGGFCSSGVRRGPGGLDFAPIMEGDVTINRRVTSCFSATDLLEVLTHETGHVLGLGHSSENPAELNPVLRDASMFFLAHFDGRGSGLRDDDLAGITALYPGDDDGDDIPDELDLCPDTPPGNPADETGCACIDPGHVACPPGDRCSVSDCHVESAECRLDPVDCTNGEPCVVGTCDLLDGCHTEPVVDFEAITCAFRRNFDPPECAGTSVPKRYRKLIRRAERQVERARGFEPGKRSRRLARVLRLLDRALVKLARAAVPTRKRPLAAPCAEALALLTEDARRRVEGEGAASLFGARPHP
jgi:hypothetical protein